MLKQKSILIVDDDRLALTLYREVIRRFKKYQIREASSGRECIAIASTHPIDLVILDYQLDDMNGQQVCREIQEVGLNPQVPVIISSMRDRSDLKKEIDCENVIKIVQKPYAVDEMNLDITQAVGAD